MKKRTIKWISAALAVILAAAFLAGCSGRNASSANYEVTDSGYSGAASFKNDAPEEAMEMAPAMEVAETEAAYEPALGKSDADAGTSDTAGEDNEALKIIYTGQISIETTEYDKTLEDLKAIFAKYGVKTASSSESDSASYYYGSDSTPVRTLTLTLRVPADHFNEFFDAAGTITGSVRSKSTDSQDLTKQYNDRAVQIESLEIQQQNLLKMMEAAKTVEEMILIEDRMSEIRYQLRSLTAANEQIDYDASYSQVDMYIREVKIYTQEKETETFVQRIVRSAKESAESFAETLQDLLVAFIYLFPYIVIIVIAVFFFRKPFRALRTKLKEKRAARKEEKRRKKESKMN